MEAETTSISIHAQSVALGSLVTALECGELPLKRRRNRIMLDNTAITDELIANSLQNHAFLGLDRAAKTTISEFFLKLEKDLHFLFKKAGMHDAFIEIERQHKREMESLDLWRIEKNTPIYSGIYNSNVSFLEKERRQKLKNLVSKITNTEIQGGIYALLIEIDLTPAKVHQGILNRIDDSIEKTTRFNAKEYIKTSLCAAAIFLLTIFFYKLALALVLVAIFLYFQSAILSIKKSLHITNLLGLRSEQKRLLEEKWKECNESASFWRP